VKRCRAGPSLALTICESFLYSFKAGLAAGSATCGASGPRSRWQLPAAVTVLPGGVSNSMPE